MTRTLEPAGAYGKRTPRDEFGLLWFTGGAPPGPAVDAAAGWLQLFLGSGNRALTALHLADGDWWLVRTEREPGGDTHGRVMGFAVFGRAGPVPGLAIPTVLRRAASGRASKTDPLPPVADDPVTPAATAPAAAAALAVAAGLPGAAVGSEGELAAVLDRVGPAACDWVAFLPDQTPTHLPAGVGVVLTAAPGPAPAATRDLADRLGPARVFALPLAGLARAAADPAARLGLVALAAGGGPPDRPLTAAAAGWLLDAGADREPVVRRLARAECGTWLASGKASPADLDALRPGLDGHRPAVRRLLAGRPDAAARYAGLFPTDGAGLLELLGPEVMGTWQALEAGTAVEAGAAERLLAAVADTPLGARLSVAQVARAAAAGSPTGRARLVQALLAAGVPDPLARAVVLGAPLAAAPPAPAALPPLSPDWLAGVGPADWARAGEQLAADPGWARWWRSGADWLVRRRALRPADLLPAGVAARDPDLLRAAGAPAELVALCDPGGGPVALPPGGPWPPAADPVLDDLARAGRLLDRWAVPDDDPGLAAGLDWLGERGGGHVLRLINDVRRAAWGDGPADPDTLRRVTRVLSRPAVLRQVVAWAGRPFDADRWDALRALTGSRRLTAAERDWLTARTLECRPVPPPPAWAVREQVVLFPLLDPVDVVRDVLDRPAAEAGEGELLRLVLDALRSPTRPPPGPFPPAAARVRPGWVQALAAIPGWAWCAGGPAGLAVVRDLCRGLDPANLAAADRAAVEQLGRPSGRTRRDGGPDVDRV